MNQAQARHLLRECRECLHDRDVDGVRALAAAENQKRGTTFRCSRRNAKKLMPYGHASDDGIGEVFLRGCEVDCRCLHERCHQTIREAGNHVRLEGHQRNVEHRSGEHGGAGSIAADAHDDIGMEAANDLCRFRDSAREIEESLESSCEADAIERTDGDQFKLKSGGGNQACLHAARGSDKKDLCVVGGLEFLGDGDGRDDVAASASARDDDAHG